MYLKTSFFSWDQPLKIKPTAKIRFGRPIGENVYDFFFTPPPICESWVLSLNMFHVHDYKMPLIR